MSMDSCERLKFFKFTFFVRREMMHPISDQLFVSLSTAICPTIFEGDGYTIICFCHLRSSKVKALLCRLLDVLSDEKIYLTRYFSNFWSAHHQSLESKVIRHQTCHQMQINYIKHPSYVTQPIVERHIHWIVYENCHLISFGNMVSAWPCKYIFQIWLPMERLQGRHNFGQQSNVYLIKWFIRVRTTATISTGDGIVSILEQCLRVILFRWNTDHGVINT